MNEEIMTVSFCGQPHCSVQLQGSTCFASCGSWRTDSKQDKVCC